MARKSRHPDRVWSRIRFRDVCGFICPYGVTYNAYGDKVFCKYPSEFVMHLVISKANREKIPVDEVDNIIIEALQEEEKKNQRDKLNDLILRGLKPSLVQLQEVDKCFSWAFYEMQIYAYHGERRERDRLSTVGMYRFLPRPAVPIPAPAPSQSWCELIKSLVGRARECVSLGEIARFYRSVFWKFSTESNEAKALRLLKNCTVQKICTTCRKFEEACECARIRSDAAKRLTSFAKMRMTRYIALQIRWIQTSSITTCNICMDDKCPQLFILSCGHAYYCPTCITGMTHDGITRCPSCRNSNTSLTDSKDFLPLCRRLFTDEQI